MSDLISRQALKNALTNWQMEYAEKGKDVERFETLGAVIDLVEQMPTIEPKREIEEFKAQAYAKGFTTALGAILDMLKGATKYENCKLYNEGYKDGESVEE